LGWPAAGDVPPLAHNQRRQRMGTITTTDGWDTTQAATINADLLAFLQS
jgi:hypothetical protein